MKCPICKKETNVIDTRSIDSGSVIRRRRKCKWCKFRFSTHEDLELLSIMVKKKDGTKEAYDREKLIEGIERACEKRPVTKNDILKLVSFIEQNIQDKKNEIVSSKLIGNLVINQLKNLDEVAYLRFASVYKSFDSAEKFRSELADLNKARNNYKNNKK